MQADEFKAMSGMVQGTPAAFANSWKARANCPDVGSSYENPCSLSLENGKEASCHIHLAKSCLQFFPISLMFSFCSKEKYAAHWCALLSDPKGVFSPCHATVNPDTYKAVSFSMSSALQCEHYAIWICSVFSLLLLTLVSVPRMRSSGLT